MKGLTGIRQIRITSSTQIQKSIQKIQQMIEESNFDLKAVNPNAKADEDTRTPEQLLDLIEAKGREVAEATAELRRLGKQ